MLDIRWSTQTQADILRIAAYWLERDPDRLSEVLATIRARADWIADNRHQSGRLVVGLPRSYRWYLERSYGYKIYYRVEGDPPETLSVITIRHSRERPLGPSTLRSYAE